MALHYTQVTIGASNTSLATGSPAPSGGSGTRTPCYMVIVQNNQTHDMRVGDTNITSTKGYLLSQSGDTGVGRNGTAVFGPLPMLNIDLNQLFVNGTQNDVVDVIYLK